jgi:hypothetical protein
MRKSAIVNTSWNNFSSGNGSAIVSGVAMPMFKFKYNSPTLSKLI